MHMSTLPSFKNGGTQGCCFDLILPESEKLLSGPMLPVLMYGQQPGQEEEEKKKIELGPISRSKMQTGLLRGI